MFSGLLFFALHNVLHLCSTDSIRCSGSLFSVFRPQILHLQANLHFCCSIAARLKRGSGQQSPRA